MKIVEVQMIDNDISSIWWKELIRYFIHKNDHLQIRCWNEETEEIKQAQHYGITHIEGNETCVDGLVNEAFISELINEKEIEDKSLYNKVTQYFTFRFWNDNRDVWSSHYGTELYMQIPDEEVDRFASIMKPYLEYFSIGIRNLDE